MGREPLLDRLRDLVRVSSGELALAALLALVVVAGAFVVSRRTAPPPAPPLRLERVEPSAPAGASPSLLVHVAGEVVTPGVYGLAAGSRVRDAVAAAGGPAPGGDPDVLNLAAPVADGEQVVVPAVGSRPPAAPAAGRPGLNRGPPARTNLNTATRAELEELPGIGPRLAERVLDYRSRKGRFTSVRDLLQVEGFGPKRVQALEDRVTVG